jgi:acyl-CoA thioesterase I
MNPIRVMRSMKKAHALLGALCAALLLVGGLPAAEAGKTVDNGKTMAPLAGFFQRLAAGKKQTVVAYGTSLTQSGYWVKAIELWLNEKYPGQATVINSGGPGQNSNWGVQQLQHAVLSHQPDLVFVEFSVNDAHSRFKLTTDQAAVNLDKIVEGIHKQNPQAAIVLETMNAVWDSPVGRKAESDRPQLEAFNDVYRKYAKEHQLPLIDNYPAWLRLRQADPERYKKLIPDGSHPNKDGSLAINWANIKMLLDAAAASAGKQR